MIGSKHLPRAAHLLTGDRAETLARRYLKAQGLTDVSRNYRCRHGEIDLIMQDTESLVFVEVRYRADQRYGTAAETISRAKVDKLKRTAEHYLQRSRRFAGSYCRFDVIGISGPLNSAQIDWIKDAF